MAEDIAATEQWRPVVGYEDLYEVSDQGRVRSKVKMLTLSTHESGHRYVSLRADGSAKALSVHRLVLLAFEGSPPEEKPNALHRDDVPGNNTLPNLYWGSRSENAYDSVRNGSHVQARKESCGLGHDLVEPNLVPSTTAVGGRCCLACKLARACHYHDEKLWAQGRARTRYNRGRDGFRRRAGETWQEEAHRRYAHIMSHGAS